MSIPRIRVLVVDDDEDDFMLTRLLFMEIKGGGFHVEWAPTREKAEEIMARREHDVYLVDYRLGMESGLDLLRESVRQGCTAPIILITGQGDADIDRQAVQAGAADYLTKGRIDAQLLDHCVRYAIERSKTMEALRQSEQRFRHLLQTANVIPWELNPATRKFTFVGHQVGAILGHPAEQGQWSDLDFWRRHIHEHDWNEVQRMIEAARDGKQQELEFRMLHASGRTVWLRALISLAPGNHGQPPGILQGFLFDVTDRKNAEEALRSSEEQLRQAQKMEAIGRLAGGVAHDFNNLLTVILGYTDMALDALTDSPGSRWANEIKKAALRAVALTRQLLAFSRRQIWQPKQVNLNAVVADMKSMLNRLIREDIQLVAQLDPQLGCIKADPVQIEQIILNLVVNARDAMPNGGRLEIGTENYESHGDSVVGGQSLPLGSYVVLKVQDNGCGMENSVRKHIFEPFFTTKAMGQGTGLGLSTVYGIVQQAGGYITVDTEVGRGTAFQIYFSRLDEPRVTDTQKSGRLPRKNGNETVLLVEDEELVRNFVRDILQLRGYRVIEARDGYQALLVAQQTTEWNIQLVITDIVMPNLNGRELADQIKQLHPDTRTLFMSGYTEDAIVRHRILGNEAPFLTKPFTAEGLITKVREVLDMPGEHLGQIS
ncbi:MAG TPA: response regulator [Candidatus Methylacidiphilales bacterium]|nr:response regulator [Candidatus Methylacidiphilales bacterium]